MNFIPAKILQVSQMVFARPINAPGFSETEIYLKGCVILELHKSNTRQYAAKGAAKCRQII